MEKEGSKNNESDSKKRAGITGMMMVIPNISRNTVRKMMTMVLVPLFTLLI